MADWEKTLEALREQFLSGSAARLDRIEADLQRLSRVPGDSEALTDLRLAFHGFSGLGGSYGFPKVTMLGQDGERHCDAVAADGREPGESDLAVWRDLLNGLRSQLGARRVTRAPESLSTSPPRGEGLVVEADPTLSAILAGVVERAGLSVRAVASGAEALAAVEARLPSVAIVDADLPDGTGFALVERMRATPGASSIAVLLVAGSADVLDRVEAIHCGADGLFEKTVNPEVLGRRLQQLLERAVAAAPRVLSVEDDPDQAGLVRAVLESAGYEVHTAAGARDFEEALAAFHPDLVLMDVLLPGGVSGYDLARILRQDERHATLPVLFLTTEQQLQSRIEAVRAGGDDHLAKPISPGLLLSTVAARIERARFLKDLVERDGLTRLLAHTPFLERVRAVHLRQLRRPDRLPAALVVLDLDHFKKVNDTWGHPVGDRVLTALAGLLRSRLRQTDSIGRLGGEEFGILLEDLTAEGAVSLVERLLADFTAIEHRGLDAASFRVTFSAGVAMSGEEPDLSSWLEAADAALYEAKHRGRNQVVGPDSKRVGGG